MIATHYRDVMRRATRSRSVRIIVLMMACNAYALATCSFGAQPAKDLDPPELSQISTDDLFVLPVERLGKGYWSMQTEWRFPSSEVQFDAEGLSLPLPFFFLNDTVVVVHQSYVLERSLKDGQPLKSVALVLPAPPATMVRLPDLSGWSWAQADAWKKPGGIYLSRRRPIETKVDTVTTFVARPNEPAKESGSLQLKISPNATRMLSLSETSVQLWDTSTPNNRPLAEYVTTPDKDENFTVRNRLITFSPDGQMFAHADESDSLVLDLYDAKTGAKKLRWNRSPSCSVQAIRFSPDAKKVFLFPYTGNPEDPFRDHHEKPPPFFEFDIAAELETEFRTDDVVVDGVFNGNEEFPVFITRNHEGSVGFWDWKKREQLASIPLRSGDVQDVAVSPDGKSVALATEEQIWFLDIATRKRIDDEVNYHHPEVRRIRFAQDGRHLGSLSAKGELRVWKLNFITSDPLEKVAPQYDGASF